ncbi:MAG TPA: PP0621 family protein [Moraxellaceae bacterium]
MSILIRLAVVGLLAWLAYRLLLRLLQPSAPASRQPPSPPADVVMRRCSWCKVHVPESESTQASGHYFCCEAHRDAFLHRQA